MPVFLPGEGENFGRNEHEEGKKDSLPERRGGIGEEGEDLSEEERATKGEGVGTETAEKTRGNVEEADGI